MSVSDTVIGIDEETRQRIFEPFYTTKERGKGTGLGLSMVHGIIKQHGGDIQVYSEEGQGTAFKVYLPAVSEEAQENKAVAQPNKISQGNETILVVEDELSVRTLAARILERFGYNVLEAEEPEAALMLMQKHAEKVHLLVSDVVIPKWTGKPCIHNSGNSIRS